MIGIVDTFSHFCEALFRRCCRKTLQAAGVQRLSYLARCNFKPWRNTSNSSSNKPSACANPANVGGKSPRPRWHSPGFPATRHTSSSRCWTNSPRNRSSARPNRPSRPPSPATRRPAPETSRAKRRADAGHHRAAGRNTGASPLSSRAAYHHADLETATGAGVSTPLNTREPAAPWPVVAGFIFSPPFSPQRRHRAPFSRPKSNSASRLRKRARGRFRRKLEPILLRRRPPTPFPTLRPP